MCSFFWSMLTNWKNIKRMGFLEGRCDKVKIKPELKRVNVLSGDQRGCGSGQSVVMLKGQGVTVVWLMGEMVVIIRVVGTREEWW